MSSLQEWPEVRFAEIFDITSSKRVLESQWKRSGIPFYRAREIVKLSESGLVENDLFIDEELYDEYKKKYGVPHAGDLMVSAVGTLGACYVVNAQDKFYFKDASVLQFRPTACIDSRFFWHAFKTQALIDQINAWSGSTVGTLTISRAKELKIKLPPLEEQRRIAAILDQADELRRRRQRTLDRLNQLGQAFFYEMFGDPACSINGWPMGTIRDLLREAKYGTSAKANTDGTGLPMLRMGNLTYDGKIDLSDLKHVELSEDEFDKYTTRPGDILFNRTNSKELVGKTAVVTQREPLAIAGYLVRARANERGNPHYISAYLNSTHGKTILRNMCKNIVGMANINAQEFQDIAIALPPKALQDAFAERILKVEVASAPMAASQSKTRVLFTSLQARAFQGEL